MSPQLRWAFALSIGVHGVILAGLPVTRPAAFDIDRGLSSVELYLAQPSPQPPAVQAQPEPLPEPIPAPEPTEEPQPQQALSQERRGAETQALPRYLRNPPPAYPQESRARGEEGTVLLEVEVLRSGRCGGVTILESSGYQRLDAAAVHAVRAWIFKPARRWQHPVNFRVEIPVTFRLDDSR